MAQAKARNRTASMLENAWVEQELGSIQLGDERLNARAAVILDRLASRPTVSIPAACRGWAETQAAYRFFDNESVTDAAVLAPHREATMRRIAQEPVVVLPQDGTEFDYTTKQEKIQGLGPLNDESRQGIFAHPTLALTPTRLCLGVVQADLWVRDGLGQRERRKQKPFEEKESRHWRDGYRLACAVAAAAPETMVVSIADREGDIYEVFAEARPDEGKRKAEWIIRAQHDRAVCVDDQHGPLWAQLEGSAPLGTLAVNVPPSAKRKERRAELTVHALTIQPRIPYRREGPLPAVQFAAVLVRETCPPTDEESIEWLLLTSLPTGTLAEARRVVEYYGCRWMIEVFFRVLKTGCQVEELQLEKVDRLRPCLAVKMIVAWRILFVTWMGRAYPNLSCEAVFAPEEWKSVWSVERGPRLPRTPPSLQEFIALVASLGGHLGRTQDGDPGSQTLWIGMQRMHDFARAWLSFGPGRKT